MSDLDIKEIINKCRPDGPRSEAEINSLMSKNVDTAQNVNRNHTFGLNANKYLTESGNQYHSDQKDNE